LAQTAAAEPTSSPRFRTPKAVVQNVFGPISQDDKAVRFRQFADTVKFAEVVPPLIQWPGRSRRHLAKPWRSGPVDVDPAPANT
jgi:hypothetical protein